MHGSGSAYATGMLHGEKKRCKVRPGVLSNALLASDRVDNPWFGKGLSFFQRICYSNAMLHFFYGIPRLVFLLMPGAYLFFGLHMINTRATIILAYVLPYLVTSNLANSRIQGQYRHSFWAEVYESVLAWYIILPTTMALINPKLGKFNVTAKGGQIDEGYLDWTISKPYLVLLGINVAAMLAGVFRIVFLHSSAPETVLMNMAWGAINMIVLGAAVGVAQEARQVRVSHRIPLHVPATLLLPDGRTLACTTSNYSVGGLDQFDIIVIHICSLSWDDLDVVNARNNPLFSRFDYVFQNFSGSASYSGPAALRVLRAACGQEAHRDLYGPAPAQCHLFADLAQLGFTPQALLNHNGQFDDFKGIVERETGVKLLPNDGLPVVMREFDNSPLVGDYAVLSRWYQQRLAAGGGPVALYYNTVTLHDGNRIPGNNMNSLQSYPLRLKMLLDDIDKLIDLVQQSGRKAVLVFVPEHGAALRGDANQIAGMREIPTPRIIHLPVGVTLIGLPKPNGVTGAASAPDAPHTAISIDTPTSFLALAQLLANLVAQNPFAPQAPPLAQYVQNLPQTRMVGENEATITLTTPTGYVIRTSDNVWMEGR